MLQPKTLVKQRKKRKKPPELVEEEEEAARAKQRAIDEDSSSTESGDDSEDDLITLLEATSPHTADSPPSTPSSAPSGNATQEFAEFDGDEELLQGMELAMATEAQCMTPQARPPPREARILPSLAPTWFQMREVDWGTELTEDTDWQFQWGTLIEKRAEKFLQYEAEGTINECTEVRCFYSSIIMMNTSTGGSTVLTPARSHSRSTSLPLYLTLALQCPTPAPSHSCSTAPHSRSAALRPCSIPL